MNLLKEKLKRLLLWKYYWEFKNLFKWTWIEIQDFKQYQIWDETRHINWKISSKYDELFVNVIGHHKDATIDIFFDINKNWLWWEKILNKDKAFDLFSDIFVYAKKHWATINSYFTEESRIRMQRIKNESDIFVLASSIEKQLNKMGNRYISNIEHFLRNQKSISKRHVIIIFSDFLNLDDYQIKTIKALNFKNEILLIKLNINKVQGINYDIFDIKKQIPYYNKLRYINLS